MPKTLSTIDRKAKKGRSLRLRMSTPKNHDIDFYRDLYAESKRALQEYQQKLQQANYRIGQLESRSIEPQFNPLSYRERREDFTSLEFLKKELADYEKEVGLLKELVKQEKTSRTIFAFITYFLLLLLPVLWYLLGLRA